MSRTKGEIKTVKEYDEIFLRICERIAEGESMRHGCLEEGINRRDFYRLMRSTNSGKWTDEEAAIRKNRYCDCVDIRTEIYGEDIIDISDGKQGVEDTNESINRDKLRVHARQWMLGKLKPTVFGNNIAAEITVIKEHPLFSSDD